MSALAIFAQVQTPTTSVLDALPHLVGVLLVMMTLFLLWGVCALTGRLVQLVAPPPVASPTVHREAPAPVEPQEGPSPEILAVIAAAVASFVGPSTRLISIRHQSTSWEKAGRQSVLSSHRIR